MAVLELAISKNWFTGTTVVEANWDRIRTPLIEWATATNRNLEQLAKDIAGSSYSLDNDGSPNLSTNLQQQITNILAGTTAFAAAVDGDFIIQANNTQANAAASTNETVGFRFGFGTDTEIGRTFFGKEQDYTNGPNSDSFYSIYTDLNGTLGERFRVGSSGNIGIAATNRLYLDGTALTGDTYIHESAANILDFVVGASTALSINGTTLAHFQNIALAVSATERLYLDGGTDTYITESAANVVSVITGGTDRFTVNHTTAQVSANSSDFLITATNRLYLDGGTDTYITEAAANQMDFITGGTQRVSITTTLFKVTNASLSIEATNRLYLDGGTDTYLIEAAANQMDFITGGTQRVSITTTLFSVTNANFAIAATNRVYLDGGIDTYIHESAANILDFVVGAATALSINGTTLAHFQNIALAVSATERVYLDGGSNTSIRESAADTLQVEVGGVDQITQTTTLTTFAQPLLLPDEDPPVANEANRNGIVKAWIRYDDSDAFVAEGNYNIAGVTDEATAGQYTIAIDTDFIASEWTCVVSGGDLGANASYGVAYVADIKAGGATVRVELKDDGGVDFDTDFTFLAIGDQ